jgi:protein SCO1
MHAGGDVMRTRAAAVWLAFASTLALGALGSPGARAAPAEPPTSRSIYQLDAPFTEDSGAQRHLRDLGGGVRVLTLIYTSCPGACPATVKALQMLERDLGTGLADTRFLLVSVDPARDTPEVLRRYRRDMQLEKDRWKLLRGSEPDVRKLAAVLGFNYEQIDSGEYVHSNLVTVLDASGTIVHQQNGVDADFTALKDAIRRTAIEDSQ